MAKKLTFKNIQTEAAVKDSFSAVKDISFEMVKLPHSGVDIKTLSPAQAIEQSLINALRLRMGGNVLFPSQGAPIEDILFNPAADLSDRRNALHSFITISEPRINIRTLNLAFDTNEFNEQIVIVDLIYNIKNEDSLRKLNFSIASTAKNTV